MENFSDLISTNKDFNNAYLVNYVLTGSNVYGLSSRPNDEFAGIHLADTLDYLQHPDYKKQTDICRFSYNKNNILVPEDNKNKAYSITSFEIWKFFSLYEKGSIVTYDILYLPSAFLNPEMSKILDLFRKGITNKIGFSAKTYALNNWQKDRTDQRKIIMSYYRLFQAIIFLRNEEYVVDANVLFNQYTQFERFKFAKIVFNKFITSYKKRSKLTEKEVTGTARELEDLIDEVNKASITTRLPDTIENDIIFEILNSVVEKRSQLIQLQTE